MDCAICLGELQNPETLPCCSKTFCADCLNNWINIRNCCPLCITPLGTAQRNELSKPTSEQFDNGSLMLQSEMANIIQRYSYLRFIVQAKREVSTNHKNVFPKYRLQLAQREMEKMHSHIEIAELALAEEDRPTATNNMQAITELIYGVQQILNGNSQIEYMQYSSDEEYYEDDHYEQEQRLYEIASSQRRNSSNKGSKKKV